MTYHGRTPQMKLVDDEGGSAGRGVAAGVCGRVGNGVAPFCGESGMSSAVIEWAGKT